MFNVLTGMYLGKNDYFFLFGFDLVEIVKKITVKSSYLFLINYV